MSRGGRGHDGPRVLLVTGARLEDAQRRAVDGLFEQIIEVPSPAHPQDIFSRAEAVTDYVLGGPEYLDSDALARLPRLRRLVLLGTGTPSFIDESAARRCGVEVFNTPHLNHDSVAEFALGTLILNSADAIASADGVRSGSSWLQTPRRTLAESRIGIVGLGHVGQALTARLHALGVRDLAYTSRARRPALESAYGIVHLPLTALLAECDMVSLHVAYSPQTHHLLDDAMFAMCRPGLRLQCFSNPSTVDPQAARRALQHGRLRQLYMDGYYREWTRNHGAADDEHGLLALPRDRFWATSHIAAQSVGVLARQLSQALGHLGGQDPGALESLIPES